MCSVFCAAVEGMELSLHALAKQGVEKDLPKVLEAIADSIAHFELFNTSRQIHSSNHRERRLENQEISPSEEDINEGKRTNWPTSSLAIG